MHWIYAHLIGDYILQNDWMANNKKKSSVACTIHVATYMLPFLFCGLSWWQFALIAGQHYLQDRTTFVTWFMARTGKTKDGFLAPPMAPWSIIVTDNVLHVLWMGFVTAIN